MSERTVPSTTNAHRDIWTLLWHALASQKTASVLLVLLAVTVLLTLLFSPQRPDPSADADVLAQWTNDAQERFGPWYATLSTLGVFDIGRTAWLRALLAWGAFTLAIGLADAVARVATARRRPNASQTALCSNGVSGSCEWQTAQERATLVGILTQKLSWPAWLPWNRLQIRPRLGETEQATCLYQDWLTWRRMGTSLAHLGLILVLTGMAIDARLGWRQEGVMLMPGQTIQLAHQPDLALRVKDAQQLEAAGQASIQIVLDGPTGASRGSVAVGRPLTAHGVTVYQHHLGPILRVSARDADGSASSGRSKTPILLTDAATEMEPTDEVHLLFTQARAEQYLLMPEIRKVVRLVLYRQGEIWDARYDELQIEVYGRNPEIPEARDSIIGEGEVELNGIVYEFAWEQYVVLDVVRSSCQWLIRTGMGLALLGLLAALLIPSARLWVRVEEGSNDGGASIVRLTGEGPGGTEALARWRQRLGGNSANG